MSIQKESKRLKVAIIGGGPAGLSVAIELGRLPFVDWKLYEKKPAISETGGGISLQPQTWRLLELNGSAKYISAGDYYRSLEGVIEERRNGRTGQLLHQRLSSADIPVQRKSCRLARSKLQGALLKMVKSRHIHVSKKLVGLEHLTNHRVRIAFEDNSEDEVDLLVAADGMKSVVRKYSFAGHALQYNGQCVYRTIVSKTKVKKIDGIPWAPVFWKHVSGLYVYTCPLGEDDFEVTVRIRPLQQEEEPVSWGHPFDLNSLLPKFSDFCIPVRQILDLAAEGETQEFALFSGPRQERMICQGSIAFVGDASHALLGNFGSGAAFALEDAYTLGKALSWACPRARPLIDALNLFDSVRSPHYQRLYTILDRFTAIKAVLQERSLSIDEEISERVRMIALASESWMYHYEIDRAVDKALQRENDRAAATL